MITRAQGWKERPWIHRFVEEQGGATSVEYFLLSAMFAVVILVATSVLGENTQKMFQFIQTTMETAFHG